MEAVARKSPIQKRARVGNQDSYRRTVFFSQIFFSTTGFTVRRSGEKILRKIIWTEKRCVIAGATAAINAICPGTLYVRTHPLLLDFLVCLTVASFMEIMERLDESEIFFLLEQLLAAAVTRGYFTF